MKDEGRRMNERKTRTRSSMESRRFLPGKTQVQPLPGACVKAEGRRQKDETDGTTIAVFLFHPSASILHPLFLGCVAQQAEHGPHKPGVDGSSPSVTHFHVRACSSIGRARV